MQNRLPCIPFGSSATPARACTVPGRGWRCGLLLCVVGALWGCGGDVERQPPAVVFVDRETGRTFSGPARPTPAVDPATGRATLMPGLFCPQCGRWYAAPPWEQLQRMPGGFRCPRHGAPLEPFGPVPPDAQELAGDGGRDKK